jgi:hypothetical protein
MPWLEHPQLIAAAVAGSVVTLIASAVLLPVIVARMPADYFVAERGGAFGQAHPALRVLFHLVKNAFGGVLLLAGIAMLFLPGQGLLTILASLSLLDFPGKRRLELQIVRLRAIQGAIVWLRRRAGRPPLQYPEGLGPRAAQGDDAQQEGHA